MKFASRLLALVTAPLLAACVNDSASYQNAGQDQAVTLVRQQRWLWDQKVEAAFVVSRLPDCQRRHVLAPISPREQIELWQPGPGTFLLRYSGGLFVTETQTCQSWQKLENEPPGGLGRQLGTFREQDGKLGFVPASQ